MELASYGDRTLAGDGDSTSGTFPSGSEADTIMGSGDAASGGAEFVSVTT